MSVNVNGVIRKLSPVACKKVEDRAAEIIAEEMSLRGRRKVRRITQARQDVHQSGQRFALEERNDLLIARLRKTLKAMDGDVRIVSLNPGSCASRAIRDL